MDVSICIIASLAWLVMPPLLNAQCLDATLRNGHPWPQASSSQCHCQAASFWSKDWRVHSVGIQGAHRTGAR